MKPMLAYSKIPNEQDLVFPLLCSHKLDGIRCSIVNGVPQTRTGKQIPNKFVRSELIKMNLPDFDGELMVPGARDFNEVQSALMSHEGKPDFVFHVFDLWSSPEPFGQRVTAYTIAAFAHEDDRVLPLAQFNIHNYKDLCQTMDDALAGGFEGLIMRKASGKYKHGRSTLREQGMLKFKRFFEHEGTVVGFKELMHNTDTSTKRKENMVGGDTLGAFVVRWMGKEFEVGSGEGLTQALRKELWLRRHKLLGARLTFKYQELSAAGVPRFPTFKVIRDARV